MITVMCKEGAWVPKQILALNTPGRSFFPGNVRDVNLKAKEHSKEAALHPFFNT